MSFLTKLHGYIFATIYLSGTGFPDMCIFQDNHVSQFFAPKQSVLVQSISASQSYISDAVIIVIYFPLFQTFLLSKDVVLVNYINTLIRSRNFKFEVSQNQKESNNFEDFNTNKRKRLTIIICVIRKQIVNLFQASVPCLYILPRNL